MTRLSERQIAVLQQMGITPYQLPAKPVSLCLLNVDEQALRHPLVLDVLQLLQISVDDCAVAASAEQCKAQRYWQLKHDMPTRPNQLSSASLEELSTAAGKRRLWQRLQAWL